MLKLRSLGFLAILFAAVGVTACSGDPGTPGTGGASTSTGSAGTCASPEATCGATCAGCGCPPCAAFAACSTTDDCAQGTACTGNIACGNSVPCPDICLPKHDGACDAAPCGADQVCSPVPGENASYCYVPAGANQPCDAHTPATCVAGFYCPTFEMVCLPQVPPGNACDSSEACTSGYSCSATTHKCVKSLQQGQACMSFDACAQGLYCDFADSSDNATCAPAGDPGQPCHNALKSCKSGKACVFPAGITCQLNIDCKTQGGACCASPNGSVCGVYSPTCLTPAGTCP